MSDIAELREEAAHTQEHGVWAKGGPVFSRLSDSTVHGLEGVALATFGDAAATGMWAFGTGCWATGLFQAGILPFGRMSMSFPMLLAYAGAVLFIAGLFLFRRNNTFLASVFCTYGAVNFSRGLLFLAENRGALPQGGSAAVLEGCLMEAFAYIALSLLIAALRMNVVMVLLLACTFVGFVLGGLPLLAAQPPPDAFAHAARIGGYVLLGAAAVAYYGGTALIVNTAWRRVVLPLGGQA